MARRGKDVGGRGFSGKRRDVLDAVEHGDLHKRGELGGGDKARLAADDVAAPIDDIHDQLFEVIDALRKARMVGSDGGSCTKALSTDLLEKIETLNETWDTLLQQPHGAEQADVILDELGLSELEAQSIIRQIKRTGVQQTDNDVSGTKADLDNIEVGLRGLVTKTKEAKEKQPEVEPHTPVKKKVTLPIQDDRPPLVPDRVKLPVTKKKKKDEEDVEVDLTGTEPDDGVLAKAGPRIEAVLDNDPSSGHGGRDYLPFLQHQQEFWRNNKLHVSIQVQVDNITPEMFAQFKGDLIKVIESVQRNETITDSGSGEINKSYRDVYSDAEIPKSDNPNQFTFNVGGSPVFEANLEKNGISITFNESNPSAQAIVAATAILSASVTMNKHITALLIKDYQENPTKGLEIYCSLASQGKPAKFDKEEETFKPGLPETKVLEFLKRLPQEQRAQLARYEDDSAALKAMVEVAKTKPTLQGAELDAALVAAANSVPGIRLTVPSAIPTPTSSQRERAGHDDATEELPSSPETPPKKRRL